MLLGSSPESHHFREVVKAASKGPGETTHDALARYADYLVGQGDVRGEWLTLAIQLVPPRAPSDDLEARRQRLAQLEGQISREWRGMMLDVSGIFNCGDSAAADPVVRFAYACPRAWESLVPTDDPDVRHCDTCQQAVTLCPTRERAEQMAREGACIAVPGVLAGDVFRDVTRTMMGRPNPVATWGARIFAAPDP